MVPADREPRRPDVVARPAPASEAAAPPSVFSVPPPTFAHLVRGVSWAAAGHAVGQASWLGSLVVIAALVSPATFGTMANALLVVQIAWLLVGPGTMGGIVVSTTLTAGQLRRRSPAMSSWRRR